MPGPGEIVSRSALLERRLLAERAWQQYLQDGHPTMAVDREICRSWQRCRESHRIDPASSHPSQVLAPDDLEERRVRDPWLSLAAPVLRHFADRRLSCGQCLAYLDGEGWMLAIEGDGQMRERLASISFRPGVNWSESSAGTNGPGHALATGKPSEVFAAEHFVAAWQSWACTAAPLGTFAEAFPAGLIDITSPWELYRPGNLALVRQIVQAINTRLQAALSVRSEVVRYALRCAHHAGDAVVAVDTAGRVLDANDSAVRRRIVEAGSLFPATREALVRQLQSDLPTTGCELSVEPPQGAAAMVSMVRYEGKVIGAIVRMAPAPRQRQHGGESRSASVRYCFQDILGRSPSLCKAIEQAEIAARKDLPVILVGESGTGKEMFAQAIHGASGRRAGPFVAVNCGAIPAQLVEAEFFGYEPGTFTGATREGKGGYFEAASGGSLFLDEITQLPLAAQSALLRVLQENEVVRLGGGRPRRVDVRIVAATNRQLDQEVRAGRFREDLYYRLHVLPIVIPSLCQRGDDVPLLAQALLTKADVDGRGLILGSGALEALCAYSWPGNVRELKNVIERAAAFASEAVILPSDLLFAPALGKAMPIAPRDRKEDPRPMAVVSDREALLAVLQSCHWNIRCATQQLGISRMTLYRWLRRHDLSRPG